MMLPREGHLLRIFIGESDRHEGMTLYEQGRVRHEPARAREVFDVSGAGDTVIATLGTMLGAGMQLEDAVALANLAAGIVVGKLGAAVVNPQELVEALAA